MVDEKTPENIPSPQEPAPRQQTTPPPPPPKKKSWIKRLVLIGGSVFVLLVVLVLFVVPPIGASIAVGKIKEQFREEMNGEIEIGSLSLSLLGGSVRLTDVKVIPQGGEPLFTLPEANAKIDVLGALGGTYDVNLVAKDALVTVVRQKDGSTNLDALLKKQQDKPAEPKEPEPPKEAEEPLDIKARVEITGSRVVFRDKKTGKETEVRNLNMKADVPSLKKNADVRLTFDLVEGGQGQVHASFNPDTQSGTVDYTIDVNALKSLEAAVGMFTPIEKLEGKVTVKGDYTIHKLPAAKGSQTLTIEGLKVVMTGREPIEIPSATVVQTVDVDEKGTGTVKIDLKSGRAANLLVNAALKEILGESGSVVGKMSFTSDLKELTDQMASLLKLKQGYRLEGTLTARSDFDFSLRSNNLNTAKIDLNANGTELVVIDSAGTRRPMETELVASLRADFNKPAGTVEIPELLLTFGDLRVSGKVSASGLQEGATPTLKDSRFDMRADLAKLMDKVGSFMELKQGATGTLDLNVVVADTAPKVSAVTLNGDFKGLKVTGLTRTNEQGKEELVDVGPLNGKLSGKMTLDMNPNAISKIESFKLQTNMAAVSMSGTVQVDTQALDLAATVRVLPEELYAAAGQLIGRRTTGQPIDAWLNVKGTAEDMTATVRVSAPDVSIVEQETMRFVNVDQRLSLTRKREAIAWTLVGNGVDGRGNGRVLTEPNLNVTMAYELVLKTPEFARFLLPAFGYKDVEIEGDPINIKGTLEIGPASRIRGALSTKSLTAKGGPLPSPVSQKNLELKFDVAQEASKLVVHEASFKSDTASGDVRGRIVTTTPVDVDMTMNFNAELERVSKDLGGLLKLKPDLVLKGTLTSGGRIKTDQGVMVVNDLTTIKNFHMSGPGIQPVDDGEVKFDADARLDAGKKILDFTRGELRSAFLYGTFKGQVLNYGEANQELRDMTIDLGYIPDKLNTVLSPWLAPAKLVGKEERKITGRLNGQATKEGILSLLKGSTGDFAVNIGQFIAEGFRMDATVQTKIDNGFVNVNGPISVNGGQVLLKGGVNLQDEASRPGFTVNAKDVSLNAENGNILGLINPTMQNAGRIDGQLNLSLEGSIPGQWESKEDLQKKLKVNGSLNIDKFVVTGSNFIQQLLEWIDVEDRNIVGYVKLPDLKIENGFVSYQLMEMRIQNTVLRFRGTIALNEERTLNLVMTAPIDDKTLKRMGLGSKERDLVGKTVEIPITGTAQDPKFDFGAPVRKFAEDYLKRTIEKELKRGLEDIFKPKKK